MPQLRADQAAIYVGVGGVQLDKNVWTTMDGGDMQATDTKTRPGGMGDEISLGGPRTRTDCTVTRQYSNDVLHPLFPSLEAACGNAGMIVSWQPLDGDGNPFSGPSGETHQISGILKEVMKSKSDANGTEAVFLTLVMSCHSTPTVVS